MLQINSSEKFPIVRKLSDPSDSGTYYVRAVIRNSLTGATLSTVNLTDEGGQRFVALYVAPTDVSGQGLWIDVVTKVYSDSGYTTQDTVYADETETYLIQERFNHNLANQFVGAGLSPDIDYKKIRKIVKEEIEKIQFPETQKIDLKPIHTHLSKIEEEICGIHIPEQEKVNLEPVFSAIYDAKIMIEKIPKPEKTDLSPVIEKVSHETDAVLKRISMVLEKIKDHEVVIRKDESVVDKKPQLNDLLKDAKEQPKQRRLIDYFR